MDSSLHYSDFGRSHNSNYRSNNSFSSSNHNSSFSSKFPNNADEDLNEIDVLQTKIAECQTKLDSMKEDAEVRHIRYEEELRKIAVQIQDAKRLSVEGLERQKISQAEKIKDLKHQLEEEKLKYDGHLRLLINQNARLDKSQKEMTAISQLSRALDIQHLEELEKSRNIETDAVRRSAVLNKTLAKKMIQYNNKQRLKRLEQEVSELQSTRREIESEFRIKRSELMNKYDVKTADNKILLTKLQQDIEERDAEYALHLVVTRKRIEKEKQATESTMKSATEQCESLQKLYHTVVKRGGQQVSLLTQDIERMRKLLEATRQNEEKYGETSLKQNQKLYNLTKSTHTIRQQATGMMDELTRTRMENEFSVSILQNSQSPIRSSPKGPTSASTSPFTPKKQSIFT
ncbi:hypothetical protein TRFO_14477 [Tritrichomonas foetus]|uniref:Uncharacterized protein n=1 Tax=Tritrichomonas foetus TaxID=1144522 RepID=A0A1J4KV55_9EUKA|nr:hypothetical protein [Tritrichomonas foetus]OHT15115.1 hypothetical protein TRFO_14477 [Tritrichomonas foetus]|eukprot:OHT15115.1 hypothetical protein TRFO_14477 [Tritrichomonas foetus]